MQKCKSASDVFSALAISLQTTLLSQLRQAGKHDLPPAIPIISGYFIISGCSHNSDLNGWCAGPPDKKKIKTDHVVECFLNMTHPNYLSDLPAQQFYFPQA